MANMREQASGAISAILGALVVILGVRRVLKPIATPSDQAPQTPETPTIDDQPESETWQARVLDVFAGLRERIKRDRLSLISGSLAYKGILSLVPALVATVSVYGLVLAPENVRSQIDKISESLPAGASELVTNQLNDIVATPAAGLGVSAVLGILIAIWGTSSGAATLIQAINLAYETTDDRPFLRRRALAIAFTLGMLALGGLAIGAMVVLPVVLREAGLDGAAAIVLQYGRIPIVFLVLLAGLALAYRYAPDRSDARIQWTSLGAVLAALLLLLVTAGFGLYVSSFGNFNDTYGALGAVIVLLLWFYLSGFVVLLGAELNAELETSVLA